MSYEDMYKYKLGSTVKARVVELKKGEDGHITEIKKVDELTTAYGA